MRLPWLRNDGLVVKKKMLNFAVVKLREAMCDGFPEFPTYILRTWRNW